MILLEYPFVFLAPFWLLPSMALVCLLIASSSELMHKVLVENHAATQTSGSVTHFLAYLWGHGFNAVRDIRAGMGTEKLCTHCSSKFSSKCRKNESIRSRRHMRCTQRSSNFGNNANELSTLAQSSSRVNEMLGSNREIRYRRTVDDRTRKPGNSKGIRSTLKPFHRQFLTVKSMMKIRSGAKHHTDSRSGQFTFATSGNCHSSKGKGRPILSIRTVKKLFADPTRPTKSSSRV
ncbi:uncharacterized protein V1513DRAFT_450855 [Lipomyces chichibuensis]|uniref:uncharacterized protein n=1 Tax=Lipomyces chichibuensis TaxID=1546026 RepID=UPI003343FBD8